MHKAAVLVVAIAIATIASLNAWSTFRDPVEWTPDALYYQARLLEIRGSDHDSAIRDTFRGPISADLRARDPRHTGDAGWVAYNEPFYERRIAVPLAGAALYPAAGDRALLYISLAGYIAAVLAIFGLLLLRFRLVVAAGVALVTAFLPALVEHSSFPLTDSWGLALEAAAFGAAVLTLDRGLRWLPLWIAAILVLSFTRDTAWIPILAVGWCALRLRSRSSLWLFGSGAAAALPAVLVFQAPVRKLLALLVNGSNIPPDTSWSFIVRHYPHALLELIRANAGFLRDGEWYTGLYFLGGAALLVVSLLWLKQRSTTTTLMTAGGVLAVVYVIAAPSFSAFRLELAFVPVAAYGIALAADLALTRLARGARAPERLAVGSPGP